MPDYRRPLPVLVEHLIITHHGQYEFRSPKLPMSPEALLLHYLDDLDSKLQSMQTTLAKDGSIEGDWTSYLPSLGRPLLKKEKFLQKVHPETSLSEEATLGVENAAGMPESDE